MSREDEKIILDGITAAAEKDLKRLMERPTDRPVGIILDLPKLSAADMEREQQAYVTRLERRNEELEAKLENCIEISPHNAKLIIQFVKKPVEGEDWEVDATVDLFWKELEKQAAKA